MKEQGRFESGSITESFGILEGSGAVIPYVMWSPVDHVSSRLILVGHGAAGDKREDYVVALAHYIVNHYGATVLSVDGPVHGDRRPSLGLNSSRPFLDFVAAWSSRDSLTDDMVRDWTDVLNAALAHGAVQPDASVAYWGLSMGTILGLPFVANEPRIKACVFGLMGETGPTRDRVVDAARSLTIPTMFIMQWHDQFFHRDDVLALFDIVGSPVKTLIANPGVHGGVPPRAFDTSVQFLFEHLKDPQ
jgi:hypothetical protein